MPPKTRKLIDTDRYKRLVETSNDLIWSVDAQGRFTFVNDAAARRIYGYSAEEMMGRPFSELMTEEQARQDFEVFERIKQGYKAFNYRTIHLRRDGTPVHLSFNAVVELSPTGEVIGTTGTATDVSDLVRYAAELERSEERYRLLFENATEPIGVAQDGRIVFFNRAVIDATGYEPDEIRSLPFTDLIHPDDRAMVVDRHLRRLRGETLPSTYVLRIVRKGGETRHMNLSGVSIVWDGRPATLNFFSDITARVNAEAELEFQAYHDPLTGLPNRVLFADRLNLALARARRHHEPIAVLYADLDHLKRVNDTLGHTIGDLLLKQAALRFRSTVREEDTVARFGGDEFVVLLSRVKDGGVAARVAEKLIARMNEPMEVGGHTLRVTTSVGVSSWPTDGDDAETLLKNADNALYQSKEHGRNTYRMFAPSMNERVQRRLSMEQSLVKAIKTSQFSLAYQPQHDMRTPRIVGYEALLRWNDEDLGDVPPASFVPLAEETRLIETIGDWVLGRALMDARRFPRHARLAVNVSAIQLRDAKFPARVARLLTAHDFPAGRLELELTESATIADDESIVSVLFELRRMGVRIAVDDFGTGYASLSYLRRLSVDMVKIDKSFIAGVGESPADSAIVLGIMGMAHGLNLLAVAEGVETEAQRDFLSVAGCDIAQGFLLGRPLPIDELGL
ncbi:MAG: EAL domain-containing protein [Vicinamibacteria bacterium]|nr:EAL domain-containing protein [Vicinamibacteria bacterium]